MPYHRPIPGRKKDSEAAGGMRMFVEAENLMQIAFILPSAVFIGWLLGALAGSRLHLGWLQYVGFFLGCAAGFVGVIRMALDAEKKAARADAASAEGAMAGKQAKSGESAGKGTDTTKS